jgi:integral membrane protein (TIGR01906 family)
MLRMMTDRTARPPIRLRPARRYDRPVRSRPAGLLIAVIVATVPLIVLGNALIVLLIPWFAHFQYALPGFPDDPFGLTGAARAELGATGIRSIWPVGAGADLLREARLPDGSPAFNAGEIRHMADVRGLVQASFLLWLAALAASAVCARSLRRLGRSADIQRALAIGASVTIGLLAVAGLAMAIDFESIFDGFHRLFFAEGTWTFGNEETLRRLYPDAFWGIAGGLLAGLALAQAVALRVWVWRRPPGGPGAQSGSGAPSGPGGSASASLPTDQ